MNFRPLASSVLPHGLGEFQGLNDDILGRSVSEVPFRSEPQLIETVIRSARFIVGLAPWQGRRGGWGLNDRRADWFDGDANDYLSQRTIHFVNHESVSSVRVGVDGLGRESHISGIESNIMIGHEVAEPDANGYQVMVRCLIINKLRTAYMTGASIRLETPFGNSWIPPEAQKPYPDEKKWSLLQWADGIRQVVNDLAAHEPVSS